MDTMIFTTGGLTFVEVS